MPIYDLIVINFCWPPKSSYRVKNTKKVCATDYVLLCIKITSKKAILS